MINPFGGTKKAKSIYTKICAPIFEFANIDTEVHETTGPLYATSIAKNLDTTQYSAAVMISGDGVFHEFVNGLLNRRDWKEAIKLPLGIVGAGL